MHWLTLSPQNHVHHITRILFGEFSTFTLYAWIALFLPMVKLAFLLLISRNWESKNKDRELSLDYHATWLKVCKFQNFLFLLEPIHGKLIVNGTSG